MSTGNKVSTGKRFSEKHGEAWKEIESKPPFHAMYSTGFLPHSAAQLYGEDRGTQGRGARGETASAMPCTEHSKTCLQKAQSTSLRHIHTYSCSVHYIHTVQDSDSYILYLSSFSLFFCFPFPTFFLQHRRTDWENGKIG